MCGIAGILNFEGSVDPRTIAQMTEVQSHRGPDDEGYCLINTRTLEVIPCSGRNTTSGVTYPSIVSAHANDFDLAFGHRRLAILDTSPAGHQPMSSADETCWIVYNGEIFNYIELREEVASHGYNFRTCTDTEVILAAYQLWGTECLNHFNGMWAFALWDSRRQHLFCARDRFGIKPFYYYFDDGQFRFASEIKSILTDSAVPRRANDRIIFDYLAYSRLDHSPETFFQSIYRLPPAHYLTLDVNYIRSGAGGAPPQRYWNLNPEHQVENRVNGYNARRFYELLEDSIRLRLRSDVSIGTCLSGGLDSSSIVCIVNSLLRQEGVASAQIGERQKTFSSCFEDLRFDERQYINEVLAATGAERNYIFPDGQRLVKELPHVVWHQDEPFGSTSIYAQWNVFRRASDRGIKVMLDGQGGDELLAGYPLYYPYYHLDLLRQGSLSGFWNEWSHYRSYHNFAVGYSLRTLLGVGTSVYSHGMKERISALIGRSPHSHCSYLSKDYIRSYARVENGHTNKFNCLFYESLYRQLVEGLPALLRYEDRDSMAFSIEARVPFLDYRLVEYAFALPADEKIRSGLTKFVLREAMLGVLPEKIRMRTDKMGFATPETTWFHNHLASFSREVIRSAKEPAKVYFDINEVERLIDKVAQDGGTASAANTLWRILNLCLWFDIFHLNGG